MSWLSRIFTLPSKYNSLSDIGKDPLGAFSSAVTTAAQVAPLFGVPLPAWVNTAAQAAGIYNALQAANDVRRGAATSLQKLASGKLPTEAQATLALQEQIVKQLMQMAMQLSTAQVPARAKSAYLRALANQMRQIQSLGPMANLPGVAASLRLQAIQNALQEMQQERQRAEAEQLQRQTLALQALQAASQATQPGLQALAGFGGVQADAARALAQFAAQMYNPQALQAGLTNLFDALMRRQRTQPNTQTQPAGASVSLAQELLTALRPQRQQNLNALLPLPNIRVR